MGIAERVKEIRSGAGLTQEGFAQRLGKTTGTIGNWERGDTTPDPGTVLLIADQFGVSADWLRHGTGPMHIDRTSRKSGGGKTPTAGSSISGIAHENGPDYRVGDSWYNQPPRPMAVNRRVAAPIIEEAERVEIDTHEFEQIQEAMDTGEPYRLRISLVRDEPQKEEGPTPQE